MLLTSLHRKQVIALYCIIFYGLMLWKWWNELFLYQVQPHLFNNRFDMTTWVLMKTGVHEWLLDNYRGGILFDSMFYCIPILFLIADRVNKKAATAAAIIMLLINWVYIQCYTLYPTNSIESYTAWLLFPILFCMRSRQSFYFVLQGLRYFFLFFFASAGIWKVLSLAVLNHEQMSAVLLYQHADYLVTSSSTWYVSFINWLVQHTVFGQSLYVAGTVFELLFIIGFFTKKYDQLLIIVFILFLLFDAFLMRIHYWEVSAFLIPMWYSKFEVRNR